MATSIVSVFWLHNPFLPHPPHVCIYDLQNLQLATRLPRTHCKRLDHDRHACAFTAPTASAATTPSASAGASGPVLEAKTDPLYSWVPWTEADLASVTVNTSAADP